MDQSKNLLGFQLLYKDTGTLFKTGLLACHRSRDPRRSNPVPRSNCNGTFVSKQVKHTLKYKFKDGWCIFWGFVQPISTTFPFRVTALRFLHCSYGVLQLFIIDEQTLCR